MSAHELAHAALNKLCKWRTVLTGRILGTRSKGDAQSDGVRDAFDKLLILRAENSALASLLVEKGVITADEFSTQVAQEAELLCDAYAKSFPGIKATDQGIVITPHIAADTMRGWPQ